MNYNQLDTGEDEETFYPPVPYQRNIPPVRLFLSYLIQSKILLIFIGLILLILFSIVLIIPIKISLSRSKHEQPSQHQNFFIEHTVTSTIITTVDHREILTCNISFTNATWDKDGVIFVNRYGKCRLDDYTLCYPLDLFIDNIHDNLYVVDSNNNRIQKYSLNQPISTDQSAIDITVASQNLMSPSSIFVDTQTEDMYILDYDRYRDKNFQNPPSYRVHLWPKNANVSRILLKERSECNFGWNSHMVLDKYMNIYVETRFHIRKWLVSTNYTQVITVAGTKDPGGNSSDELQDPRGLYIDNNLTMYIADWNNHRVQKWIMNGDEGITLVSNLQYVYGMTQDCNGNLYYADAFRNTIYQLNLETNQTRIAISNEENVHNGRYEGLWMPFGMRFDKFGNMFVIDFQHSRIRKYSIL